MTHWILRPPNALLYGFQTFLSIFTLLCITFYKFRIEHIHEIDRIWEPAAEFKNDYDSCTQTTKSRTTIYGAFSRYLDAIIFCQP